jgi:hypothetical protein
MVTASARVIASVVLLASLSSQASAANCHGLRRAARFYCIAQNHPQKYVQCNEFAVVRGFSNIAPGRANFILACMKGRVVGAPASRRPFRT